MKYKGGYGDAFIAKVKRDGSGFEYCGYIGGVGNDEGNAVAVDAAGNAYVAGTTWTDEKTFPVAVGPDLTFNGGGKNPMDAFVAKVDRTGKALLYCGYIGGDHTDQGWAIAVDRFGRAYVAGQAQSTEKTFPVRNGPDSSYNDDQTHGDAFIARVDRWGLGLDFCGYIGGKARDTANGVAIDAWGNVFVGGMTYSDERSFPVRVGPDLTYNDMRPGTYGDSFVAKIGVTWLVLGGKTGIGETVQLSLSASHGAGLRYQAGSSLGAGPVWIGPHRLDLSADALLAASVSGTLPGVFVRYAGTLSAAGTATAEIRIPNDGGLVGLTIHSAFVVLRPAAPEGVDSVSPARSFVVTR